MLRAYHGEHIRERDWNRMFDRRLLSVVNMDPRAMAMSDGSEQAAGRGLYSVIRHSSIEIVASHLADRTRAVPRRAPLGIARRSETQSAGV